MRRSRIAGTLADALEGFDCSGGPDACWPWMRSKDRDGYGKRGIAGRAWLAHRAVAAHFIGPVDGRVVRHTCDNPACGNPAHLRIGTIQENMQDRTERRRTNSVLREDDVHAIREALDRGEYGHVIAARFGVTAGAIYSIANGRTWAWLPREGGIAA